jgi:hypothetical protein
VASVVLGIGGSACGGLARGGWCLSLCSGFEGVPCPRISIGLLQRVLLRRTLLGSQLAALERGSLPTRGLAVVVLGPQVLLSAVVDAAPSG